MKNTSTKIRFVGLLATIIIGLPTFVGCVGDDFTPVYFPPPGSEADGDPSSDKSIGGRSCTVSFTSQLCVMIKGDNIDVGSDEEDRLCAEVPPFPIHIQGATARVEGSEFPEISFEGGGLPAPIMINGTGDGDGTTNVGEGEVDGAGNMAINGFSFFINVLGVAAEIPNLTLTTGTSQEMSHLDPATGSPPDASGAMTLVIGTVLGHIIDAADTYLLGASMVATFDGSISPPLTQCGGEAERSIEVKKLVIDENGRHLESQIPEDKYMEISDGTFIADRDSDIGSRYEAIAKFSVRNISAKAQRIKIPPKQGPFHFSSVDSLTLTLKPQQSFVLNVKFRPTPAEMEPGEITESISIGPDQFFLLAVALSKSGDGSVNVVDDGGKVTKPDAEKIEVGESAVPANTEKAFFLCKEIECNGAKSFTECKECPDPATNPCELLSISTEGHPIGEVDKSCKLKHPDATPLFTIDLKGATDVSLDAKKQVLAIRNKGVKKLTITKISLEDVEGSKSKGQFSLPKGAIFVAGGYDKIKDEVARALSGEKAQGTKFPIELPPFQPGYNESTAYVVVTYEPNDLIGADGQSAGVGSKVKDKATLIISTDDGDIRTTLVGTTTIRESPALELYFKTTVGTKYVADKRAFPFRGVTTSTLDLGIPLFLRAADAASNILRIMSISISGDDAEMFQWLDTNDKIQAIQPPEGKGMRCSIPIIDETTGEMIDESFDLNPVSLSPKGYDLPPGAHTTDSMPLFGCINFHRDESSKIEKIIFIADLTVVAQELDATGNPAKNPDGSYKQTTLTAKLQAAIDPRRGKLVLRVTQSMIAVLNPKFPGLSGVSSRKDNAGKVEKGLMKETDYEVFIGSMILDPFDEMTIKTSDGERVVSTPNDGMTAVFRNLDTHPVSHDYENEWLFDYANLLHNTILDVGDQGIFEDYPNVPDDTQINGWRIFTSTLSYPGPIVPEGVKSPAHPSDCAVINPCDPEGLKLFTKAGIPPGGKGACAFFYASGGRIDSPAFHTKDEMEDGEYENLCKRIDMPQTLYDIDTGHYSVDGSLNVEEVGFRLFGPSYFHNPGGPLGDFPPMDDVLYVAFTTELLKPQDDPEEPDLLPDKRINLAKNEFKINLDDPTVDSPPICKNNTKNKMINGKAYSTWRFFEGHIFKDEDGTIPAGCPEDDNDYIGGSAYMRGMPLDHETGNLTLVSAGKFSSNEDLSFGFKDVITFIVLKGWLCDPTRSEDEFEGSKCFDVKFNDRDAASQKSLIK